MTSSSNAHRDPATELRAQDDTAPAIESRDYDAHVTNPDDGTRLALTVLQPALAAGQPAPLILHSHGFGGARLTGRGRRTVYEQLSGGTLPSAEAARRAVDAGFFVISFDQRGFGESEGQVRIMDPEAEGRDISAILDWAEHNMPAHAHLAYRGEQPMVGGLGLSYGGAFQLMGACVDARFSAIVPTATWYDLRYSLAPDNVVKTAWGVGLVGLGVPASGVTLDPMLYRALLEGLASPLTGRGLSDSVADRLYNHSPASYYNGDVLDKGEHRASAERTTPKVDALLIQGIGDTLFNLNEGLANARTLRAAGNDVKLIAMRHGHSLPFLQDIDRIAYQTEASLHWGDQRTETAALQLAWLDHKLRGAELPQELPDNCAIVDDDTGVVFDEWPVGRGEQGASFSFETQIATGGLDLLHGVLREHTLAGLWQIVAGTANNAKAVLGRLLGTDDDRPASPEDTATLARLVNAMPADHLDELASGGRFVPLQRIDGDSQAIIGIPTARLEISGKARAPVVFIGVGIQRPGQTATLLVNKQVRPVRGTGRRDIELNGVAERLQTGDEIGLLVYGYHPQYLASFSALPGQLALSGEIDLPLLDLATR